MNILVFVVTNINKKKKCIRPEKNQRIFTFERNYRTTNTAIFTFLVYYIWFYLKIDSNSSRFAANRKKNTHK